MSAEKQGGALAQKMASLPVQHTKVLGKDTHVELPAPVAGEVAFIGRSNVGKSSLLNAVLGRKKLAKISHTPGATRALHFYEVGDPTSLVLVDLPGYGFAQLGRKTADNLAARVRYYLKNRENLKTVCVLVDARRGLKESDEEMLAALAENQIPTAIIFTKADKVPAAEQKRLEKAATETLTSIWAELANSSDGEEGVAPPETPVSVKISGVFMTSAIKKVGLDDVRKLICRITAE